MRAEMLITEGEVLAGKFRVERVLGQGGMGVVVAAHHLQLDERVAIKFLLPEAVTNPEIVGRFVQEARAAVRIKSEHVARVSDVGTLEGGEPYMVMEYLEGLDLDAWLRTHGALSMEQAVEFMLQACEAIAEAHALGIIHRDLKPANLFAVRRADGLWSVKVLDFGISKVTALGATGQRANLTRTSAVIGSPLYMPPEQMAASKTVDGRADIWALGVILYELLTGNAPFSGETLPEVCMKIAIEPPPAIRSIRPDLPPPIEGVILRCLEKDRERRYANVAEFARALAQFGPPRSRNSVDRISRTIEAAGLAHAPHPPPESDSNEPVARIGDATAAPWGRTTGAPRRRRMAAVIAAGSALALAGLTFGVRKVSSSASASASPVPSASSAVHQVEPGLGAPALSMAPAAPSSPREPSVSPASTSAALSPSALVIPPAASSAATLPKLGRHVKNPERVKPVRHTSTTAVSGSAPAPETSIFDDR